jgi:hypothetical protein
LERCLISLSRSFGFEDWVLSGLAPGTQFLNGLSGGQTKSGACRSEEFVAGQLVPDRIREPAGEVDLRDLGAALAAEAARLSRW